MRIEKLMSKLGITEGDISIISNCMMEDLSLTEAASRFPINYMRPEKVFMIALMVSEDIFGEDIMIAAPKMSLERLSMSEELYDKWQSTKAKARAKKWEADEEAFLKMDRQKEAEAAQ